MKRLLLILASLSAAMSAQQVWVGPLTVDVLDPATPNPDYIQALGNRAGWQYVSANAQVVELWMGAFQTWQYREEAGPFPFDAGAYWKPLAAALSDKQVSMQIAGLFLGEWIPNSCLLTTSTVEGVGPSTARAAVLPILRRFVAEGGHWNYLTIDNAMGHAMSASLAGKCGAARFTTKQLAREQALAIRTIHAEFPDIQIGVTDGLGGSSVSGLDGTQYPADQGYPYAVSLSELLTTEVSEARAAGETIAFFILDSAQTPVTAGAKYLGMSGGATWDYGRGMAAEALARNLGMRVGIYITEPPRSTTPYMAAFSDMVAMESDYITNYLTQDARAGAKPDFMVLENWYGTVPNFVGAESQLGSEWYMDAKHIDTLRAAGWSTPTGTGPAPKAPTLTASMTGSGFDFTFTFIDGNGAPNIAVGNILIGKVLAGEHSCYLAYVPAAGRLYLVNDAGTGLAPGLSNGQCSASLVSVTTAGTIISVRVFVTLTQKTTNTVWAATRETGDRATSGWVAVGTIGSN